MLQPFEKGKSFSDHAIPVAELLQKVGKVLKEVEGLRKKVGGKI
jgi:hypothetical protein